MRPLEIMDRDMVSVLDLVYESVVELNDDRQPEMGLGLAESWEVSNNGQVWIFTLRQGVYFHDGREMKASDVAATMDAIAAIARDESREDNQKGLYCKLPDMISSWTAEDDYTLTVRTDRPYYGLLYIMTFPVLQAQSIYDDNPPGTGPYRMDYYAPGDTLYLSGNQNWWGGSIPYISEIKGIWYEDIDAALTAFEAEEVDIVMTRSTSALRYRGTISSRVNVYDYATRQLECLMMSNAKQLATLEMRQAVVYAIDKSRLITGVYQDMVTTTDTLESPASWLYNESTVRYEYNPQRAIELLEGLGWTDVNDDCNRFKRTESGDTVLNLRLAYYDEAGSTLRREAANEIATMLKAVGIQTTMTAYSFENAMKKLATNVRDYDLFLCAYNFDTPPDPSFILLSNGYGNSAGYRSDEMNALCQELRKAYEAETFREVWFDIQALAAQDLPFWPLYWRDGVVLTRYPYSSVRDIREYELLSSIEQVK